MLRWAPFQAGAGAGWLRRHRPINAPQVAALKLDELELASLRGDLQACGSPQCTVPRYSGLRGDSLRGGFRWERDVVRLEKLVVQQQRSR